MADDWDAAVERRVEWRVTWFPFDAPERSQTSVDEGKIRRTAEAHAEFNPIVESRVIEVGPWEMVENLADRPRA